MATVNRSPWIVAGFALIALTACGVDGPPVPPPAKESPAERTSGVAITGEVKAGVVVR